MRNYGQFTTSIWQDSDFTSLSQPLQQVYFMLGLQPNMSAAGTLALTTGRWARMAGGVTRTELEEQLVALQAHAGRHVVIDEDTEELLIRKFMKWDGGWYNEKRAPVVADAIRCISSVHIRDIAVDELRRLIPSHALSARAKDALYVVLSDGAADTPGSSFSPLPLALDLNPKPQPGAVAAADAAPPSMFCDQHPNGTTEKCGTCARAREMYAAWTQSSLAAELEAKQARRDEIAACPFCDLSGKRVDPRSGRVIARFCDHVPAAESSAVGGGV